MKLKGCSATFYPFAGGTVLTSSLNSLLRVLLPPTCLFCGAAGAAQRDLCAGCAAELPLNVPACRVCAMPLAEHALPVCSACQTQPPIYDHAFVPFRYQAPLDFSISQLKFAGRLAHARLLGELFAAALRASQVALPDCLIPIPLHSLRLRERGFNQSLELARPVAAQLQIPLLTNAIQRVRYTTPQSQLHTRARYGNLRGAFILRQPMTGRRVALFDDVLTTASTVSECAKVLRSGAVREVQVWVIARAGVDSLASYPTVEPTSSA